MPAKRVGEKEETMAHTVRNKLRGLAAAAVAGAAALAIAPATAFAAPVSGSVTIDGLAPDDVVTLYKVIDIDVDDTTNVASPSWAAGLADENSSFGDNEMDTWMGFAEKDDPDSAQEQAFANQIAQEVSEDTGRFVQNPVSKDHPNGLYVTYTSEAAGEDRKVTISDVESGEYLVVVSTEDASVTRVYQDTIVGVFPGDSNSDGVFDVEGTTGSATLKCTDMGEGKPDKSVLENGTPVSETDNSDRLSEVQFQITSLVPFYTDVNKRTYTVTDTMSDGLLLDWGEEWNAESTLAPEFIDSVKLGAENLEYGTDYTVQQGGASDTWDFKLSLTATGLDKVDTKAGKTLTIEFTASVDDDASYKDDVNNQADLEFSNDSVTDDKTYSDSDKVDIDLYGLQFTKVGKDNEEKGLQNAVFEIYKGERVAPENRVDSFTSGSNGVVTLDGLAEGTYIVHEASAPAGYAPIADFTLVIRDGGSATITTTDGSTLTATDAVNGLIVIKEHVVDPENDLSTMLPTTGGTGTVALTAAGVVLVAGAAAFIVRSRKQN